MAAVLIGAVTVAYFLVLALVMLARR